MSIVKLPDVVIENGAVVSNVIDGISIEDADGMWFFNVDYDIAQTYVIQVCPDLKPNGSSVWTDLVDTAGNEIVPPDADNSVFIPLLNVSFRVVASGAVAGDVSWNVRKLWSGL